MSSRLRTVLFVVVIVLILAAVAFYFLDPDARLKGVIAGEPKYDGRSASAWVRDLSGGDENSRAHRTRPTTATIPTTRAPILVNARRPPAR